MINHNKSKIDWKTIFAGVGTLGAVLVAVLQFSASSNSAADLRMKELEIRVCRLEAVQAIGPCKR